MAQKKDNSFSGALLKSAKFGANSKEDFSKFWTLFRDKGKLRNVAKHVKVLILNIFLVVTPFKKACSANDLQYRYHSYIELYMYNPCLKVA